MKKVNKQKDNGENEPLFNRLKNKCLNNPIIAYSCLTLLALGGIKTFWGTFGQKMFTEGKVVVHNINSRIHLSRTTLKIMMKKAEPRELLTIIEDYYNDMKYDQFRAEKYFAPIVNRYEREPNVTPARLDSMYTINKKEFIAPDIDIVDTGLTFTQDTSGIKKIDFWTKFSCFRKSHGKYEFCLCHVEFVFNNENKITVSDELEQRNLQFSNEKVIM